MKTIIVATDYSKEAENAMEYAAGAAQVIGAKVILFHLYKLSVHALNSRLNPASFEDLYNTSRRKLEEKAHNLSQRFGIEVVADWYKDDFYDRLKQSIRVNNADLLVLGMPEKSLEQDLLGNTTTAAIHRLKFPVLAVPIGAKFNGIKRILFAADVLRGVHINILDKVKEVANDFGAIEVEIFHVSNKVKEIEEKGLAVSTENAFGEGNESVRYFYKNVESNAVLQEIQREIHEVEADMLIMVPNKYGFWGSLIHRSKTRIMASGTEVPLMSLPL